MKYIKTFETYKLISYDKKALLDRISLCKVADRIYSVVVKDSHLRAMLFLRFQEFYEGTSTEFRGNKFKWDRYIQWYKSSEGPNGERELFTYGSDWTGFNIPSEVIENCYKAGIDDPNEYDRIMRSIIDTIRREEKEKFYLIGIEELDFNTSYVLDHEISHGFFYTDIEYRNKTIELINKIDEEARLILSKIILDYGYDNTVLNDELQAYLSTGLTGKMTKMLKEKGFDLSNEESIFSKNFEIFKNKHNIKLTKINIIF